MGWKCIISARTLLTSLERRLVSELSWMELMCDGHTGWLRRRYTWSLTRWSSQSGGQCRPVPLSCLFLLWTSSAFCCDLSGPNTRSWVWFWEVDISKVCTSWFRAALPVFRSLACGFLCRFGMNGFWIHSCCSHIQTLECLWVFDARV